MNGTIKWYNKEKGYGFIVGEDSQDYFVHYTALPQGQQDIRNEENVKVSFEVIDSQRGKQAQEVVFLKGEKAKESTPESDEE
ncbi:MAG: cold shock domain-containing protein [Nanoarchaeota archaeon]|nr:cold shock domain-containing protein [Nanoarchaeota archaeon]